MFRVRDIRHLCSKPTGRRRQSTDYLVVHRTSRARDPDGDCIPDEILTGEQVAEWYKDTREFRPGAYTGGRVPYSIFVQHDGTCDQLTELDISTPHARRYNGMSLAVAFAGNFNLDPPTGVQVHVGEQLLGLLMAFYQCPIFGHDMLDGASRDPDKRCPGVYFPLVQIAYAASEVAASFGTYEAGETLEQWGFHIRSRR